MTTIAFRVLVPCLPWVKDLPGLPRGGPRGP